MDEDSNSKYDEGEPYALIKLTQAGASSDDKKYIFSTGSYAQMPIEDGFADFYSNYLPSELELEVPESIKDFVEFNIYATDRAGLICVTSELIGERQGFDYAAVIIKSKATGKSLIGISVY